MGGDTRYDAKKEWSGLFLKSRLSFPSEYVIRILKGAFPRLNLDKGAFRGSKFCDVGCGDGRNLLLAKTCGFDAYGVEISTEIVDKVNSNLRNAGIEGVNVRAGTNDKIPFGDAFFDYLLSKAQAVSKRNIAEATDTGRIAVISSLSIGCTNPTIVLG